MTVKISDHGLIGNCRTSALVSKTGDIAWCCLPRFDSPSIFASILDDQVGGKFSLTPLNQHNATQEYLDDTNVLKTTFISEEGQSDLIDCFTVTTEEEKRRILLPQHEILRLLRGTSGAMKFRLHFEPRPHYGKKAVSISMLGKSVIRCDYGSETLFLQTTIPFQDITITKIDNRAYVTADFHLDAGTEFQFSLTYSTVAPAIIPSLQEAQKRYHSTIDFWKRWISQCTFEGLYKDQVKRSVLALKLLAFAPSGAIIAAPTTSLPERAGGVRNWDYRYCWLRDASFTVRSFLATGFVEEARAYIYWLLHTTHLTKPMVKVLYDLYGESKIPEEELPWLSGYLHSRPVRVGNAADLQFQLDVYGEVLNAIYYFAPSSKEFDKITRDFVINMGKIVCELWHRPDEGIWEVRSEKVHHTHSKALAWVALDRVTKLADLYGWEAPVEKFKMVADKIKEEIERYGYNETINSYTRAFDRPEIDASSLVLPLVGYCEADSKRMENTINTIIKELSHDGLIYRYRSVDDGLPGKEGAFSLCNFWMVQALARAGRIEEAKEWFENMLTQSNSLGLMSEEIEPATGDFLGNYPQAFSHTGLINAAITLTHEMNQRGVSL